MKKFFCGIAFCILAFSLLYAAPPTLIENLSVSNINATGAISNTGPTVLNGTLNLGSNMNGGGNLATNFGTIYATNFSGSGSGLTGVLGNSTTNSGNYFDTKYDIMRINLENALGGGTFTSSNQNAGVIRFWKNKADSGSRALAVPSRYTYIKKLILTADYSVGSLAIGTNLFMAVNFGNPNTSQGSATGVGHLNDLSGAPAGGGDSAYSTNVLLSVVQVATNYAGTTVYSFSITNAVAIPSSIESDAYGLRRIMFFSLTMPISQGNNALTNNNNYSDSGFVEFGTTPDQLP